MYLVDIDGFAACCRGCLWLATGACPAAMVRLEAVRLLGDLAALPGWSSTGEDLRRHVSNTCWTQLLGCGRGVTYTQSQLLRRLLGWCVHFSLQLQAPCSKAEPSSEYSGAVVTSLWQDTACHHGRLSTHQASNIRAAIRADLLPLPDCCRGGAASGTDAGDPMRSVWLKELARLCCGPLLPGGSPCPPSVSGSSRVPWPTRKCTKCFGMQACHPQKGATCFPWLLGQPWSAGRLFHPWCTSCISRSATSLAAGTLPQDLCDDRTSCVIYRKPLRCRA
jgi:hypothetical protein